MEIKSQFDGEQRYFSLPAFCSTFYVLLNEIAEPIEELPRQEIQCETLSPVSQFMVFW